MNWLIDKTRNGVKTFMIKNYYDMSPDYDPMGPTSGIKRLKRGGSWNDYAKSCRSVFRGSFNP